MARPACRPSEACADGGALPCALARPLAASWPPCPATVAARGRPWPWPWPWASCCCGGAPSARQSERIPNREAQTGQQGTATETRREGAVAATDGAAAPSAVLLGAPACAGAGGEDRGLITAVRPVLAPVPPRCSAAAVRGRPGTETWNVHVPAAAAAASLEVATGAPEAAGAAVSERANSAPTTEPLRSSRLAARRRPLSLSLSPARAARCGRHDGRDETAAQPGQRRPSLESGSAASALAAAEGNIAETAQRPSTEAADAAPFDAAPVVVPSSSAAAAAPARLGRRPTLAAAASAADCGAASAWAADADADACGNSSRETGFAASAAAIAVGTSRETAGAGVAASRSTLSSPLDEAGGTARVEAKAKAVDASAGGLPMAGVAVSSPVAPPARRGDACKSSPSRVTA